MSSSQRPVTRKSRKQSHPIKQIEVRFRLIPHANEALVPHANEALGHAGCALRRRSALEPATPAVPAATEKNQHNDEDYEKCRRVHTAS
jgi:hypothetical protein